MKIVTSVGFTCSGSSVINNLLREYDNFCELTPNNECRFLQDPDGISDLEYNLFDNRHRLNSEYAIKRYLKYTEKYDVRNFRQIFGKEWDKYNKEFVNSIIMFSYNSYWHADLRDLTLLQKLKYYSCRATRIIFSKIFGISRENNKNYFPNKKMFLPINGRNEFINKVNIFTNNLFQFLNKDNKEFGVVDQLVPPRNIKRYMKYVQGLYVIVVDRDPRDVYIEALLKNDRAFPKDVKQFCQIYRDNRIGNIENDENVLYIKFEDLVLNYNDSIDKINKFLDINIKHHINQGKYFSIEKSKKNIELWKKYPEFSNQIKYIENNLKEYLYND